MRGYRRGRTPASTWGDRRPRSRTRCPAIIVATRSRTASVASSVEPRSRNLTFSPASRTRRLREMRPARYAARAQWKPDEPAISVRSRSKKAAERPAKRLGPRDPEDDGGALPAARADGRAAEAAAAPAELVDQRAEDPRAGRADRV